MRAHHTYRSERRNDWRKLDGVTWLEHNAKAPGADPWHIGSIQKPRRPVTYHLRASRYMPHIGAKERARHAGKPEGAMHVTGHQRMATLLAWIAEQNAA